MKTSHGPIPRSWSRLWWAKSPTGDQYVVGRIYNRGDRFHPTTRRWKCKAIYQTTKGHIVAVASFPDDPSPKNKPYTTLLTINVGDPSGWLLETDVDRNTKIQDRCTFCRREVMVRPYNRRARDKCPCGARHFMRLVKDWRGETIAEEEGWRKNGKEWIRC